ncbi:MAG TPA: hypothetical protein ENJ82_12295, partial [Bacteroidetes bacterium]|nr:hypothetical protein [Bacteroidota bacterium]
MNLKLLVFILFWSICSDIWSQQFPNYHLGTREGLPHSIVYRVMEDQRGFLWISTEGGIARYDGTNMQCYAAESGLEADMVLHVSEDENQVIWANVYLAGPHRLVDGKFEPDQPLRGKWPLVPVKSVHTPGRTWCLDADGFLYVKDGDEVKQDTSLGDGKIFRDMLVCTDGRMVVLTTKGLYTFLEAGTWQKMDLPSEIKEVECMTVDASGALWLANQQGFYRLENGKVSRYLPWEKENPPDQFVVDRAGKVWASDFESLYLEQEGSYTNVTSRLGRKDLKINHLFIDHQNNLWISTYGSGLICVQSVQILNFLSSLPQLRSPINAITHTQDKLYFACVGLISQYEEGIISPVYSPFHGRKDYPYFIQKWGENLIVGNPSGAFLFDPDEPEKQKSLISEGVLAAYIDSSGG